MMIMITRPVGKLKKLLTVAACGLLVGVAVPLGYTVLGDMGAMSLFAAGDNVSAETGMVQGVAADEGASEEELTEEAAEEAAEAGGVRQSVRQVIFGEERQVIRY